MAMPKLKKLIYDCCVHIWYICYCWCIAGHSLDALMYLKTKTLNIIHLHNFLQLLQKVHVSGCFFGFSIPSPICNIEVTIFYVFKFYLRFRSRTAFFFLSENSGIRSNISFSMSAVKKKGST